MADFCLGALSLQLAYGGLGVPGKLFSSEGALKFPPRLFTSPYSIRSIKVRQSQGSGVCLRNGVQEKWEEVLSHRSILVSPHTGWPTGSAGQGLGLEFFFFFFELVSDR